MFSWSFSNYEKKLKESETTAMIKQRCANVQSKETTVYVQSTIFEFPKTEILTSVVNWKSSVCFSNIFVNSSKKTYFHYLILALTLIFFLLLFILIYILSLWYTFFILVYLYRFHLFSFFVP